MTARNEDFLFAQEAQNLGYVTEEQVEEGFLLQQRMSDDLQIDERLAVILVKRGWMAEEQARRVYGIIEPEGARSRIEGYRLVQKIGRGAMGTVYKAIHKGLHRVVAIKILRRELAADKTQIERLKREAQLLADLDHPNIVRAFDAGESNGFPYLVMEYVEGDTLREHIAKQGTLGDEEALRITRALADALEKARRMGVVHRDVKPGNILMTRSGQPKLMDLGLAKGPLDMGLTQHGATVGTPQFMSPEQAESPDKADTRSDIYSLGATLYAMVTGRPPFEGSTLAEILTKVMSQQPVPPRVRNADVSPEVSHLIERMMLKDASLRYATPAEVIADIDMIRGGQSIIPRGFQGNWEAYLLRQRFLRWRRRIVAGLAAAAVLAVGGAIWWRSIEKESARNEIARHERAALELEEVRASHTLARLEEMLAQTSEHLERIKRLEMGYDVAGDNRLAVEQRVENLRRAVNYTRRVAGIEHRVRELLAGKQYATAHKELGSTDRDLQHVKPAAARLRALQAEVPRQSDAELARRSDELLATSATDLDAFEAKWKAYADVFHDQWVETRMLQDGRLAAETAAAKATEIASGLRAFVAAYEPDVVRARVEALDFYDLGLQVRRDRERALAEVGAHLDAWPASLKRPGIARPKGIVQVVLAGPVRIVDAQVRAHWARLREEVEALPTAEALRRLRSFVTEADRGTYFSDLAGEAESLLTRIEADAASSAQRSAELFAQVREDVLAALRRGLPGEMERRLDEGLAEGAGLTAAMRAELRGLRAGAGSVRAVQAAALAWLAGQGRGQTLEDVDVRGPGGTWVTHAQFRVDAVGVPSRTLQVRLTRKGSSRRETMAIGLGEVHPGRVLAWARSSGQELPPGAQAFARLAALPAVVDEPGRDLRKTRGGYRDVATRFSEAGLEAWRDLVEELRRRLDTLQKSREESAADALAYADYFCDRRKHKAALGLYRDLVDPDGRMRHTDKVDGVLDYVNKQRATCELVLAEEEMLRLFYGSPDVKDLKHVAGARHRILFDFDDPGQLENFARGFGALEPTDRIVTPERGAQSYRLHLLKGVRGVLRDRPLSLESMFDPAELIVLRVRIEVERGVPLLAFDLDGVQIAICSADPNFWRRRFPPGTPLVEDEDALPEFDFYGLGRGLAFHEGKDFGRIFPQGNWDWPSRVAGRHFERWKDRAYLQKHRDELFAFEPGRAYDVRIERERDRLRLFVDGELIVERREASWAKRGAHSATDRQIRNGSGYIQILTWTPLRIDDLEIEGKVSERWKDRRRARMASDEDAGKRPK